MEELKAYLSSLPDVSAREQFAANCGTTLAYLRKMMSVWPELKFGEGLAINIERNSEGAVRCESLRPDVDWAYLRGSGNREPCSATRANSR